MASHSYLVSLLVLANVIWEVEGYDLVFRPQEGYLAPRALLTNSDMNPITQLASTEFSFCLWTYIEAYYGMTNIALVSFSSTESGQTNEILLEATYFSDYTSLYVNGQGVPFDDIPFLDQWTHLCCTWKSQSGEARLYINGQLHDAKRNVKKGEKIGGKGYLILGQDQDDYNGGFEPKQGMRGRLTGFNFWKRALSKEEVKGVYNCSNLQGDVVNWDSSLWNLYGNIQARKSDNPCESCSQEK